MRAALILSVLTLAGCEMLLPSNPPDGWTVDGDIRFIDAPAAVSPGELEGNAIFAFDEGETVSRGEVPVDWAPIEDTGLVLPGIGDRIDAEAEKVPEDATDWADRELRSVYFHVDPRGIPSTPVRVEGTVDFGTPIRGIVTTDNRLSVTDDSVGLTQTIYPSADLEGRGSIWSDEDNEQLVVESPGSLLRINLVDDEMDSFRVILDPGLALPDPDVVAPQADLSDAETVAGLGTWVMPAYAFVLMIPSESASCPVREESGNEVVFKGGCVTSDGLAVQGQATAVLEGDRYSITYEEFGWTKSVPCDEGGARSQSVALSGSGTADPSGVLSLTGTPEPGTVELDLVVTERSVDPASCSASTTSVDVDMRYSVKVVEELSVVDGSGEVTSDELGRARAELVDVAIAGCNQEYGSGSLELDAGGRVARVEFDGDVDCDTEGSPWFLDGVEQGKVYIAICGTMPVGGAVVTLAAMLVVAGFRRRRDR